MNLETVLQDYKLYIAGGLFIILLISFKSEEFRNWVIRLTIFLLIISLCYFGFQKIQYRFKSGKEVNPFNEEMQPKENAGMKYYRDPSQQIEEQTGK